MFSEDNSDIEISDLFDELRDSIEEELANSDSLFTRAICDVIIALVESKMFSIESEHYKIK